MKKQPQQPEQQRSDYSASALSERPDRASGDRDLLPCPFCGSEPKSDNSFLPLEGVWYAWCSNDDCELSPVGREERLFSVEWWNKRATNPSGGHDASSEPRQNETNAVDAVRLEAGTPFPNCKFRMCDLPGQCIGEGKCHHPIDASSAVAVREALAELVRTSEQLPIASTIGHFARTKFQPALERARALLEEKP